MKLYNFRDLGGLHTTTNQKIKPGLLFRTGNVAHWSAQAARHVVEERGVKLYIDFRSPIEVQKFGKPQALIEQKIEWLPISIDTSDEEFEKIKLPKAQDWLKLYQKLFEKNMNSWALFTKTISSAHYPIMYGCLFGKDRTGIATSLLLNLLDVHDKQIVADYAKTTHEIKPLSEMFENMLDNHGATEEEIFEHYSRSHEEVMYGFLEYLRIHPEHSILKVHLKKLFDNYQNQLKIRLLE